MNKELKPCPFCGGKAQLDHDGLADYSYVRCMECHARTRDITVASYHCSDDKAIELWNHRADVRENVRGRWVEVVDRTEMYDKEGVKTWGMLFQCNQCGFVLNAIEGHTGQYNFCPNCGADMR